MQDVGAAEGGIVYVLTNEAMPNLVKIGRTSGEGVGRRVAELSRATGVPLPFRVAVARRVSDAFALELALHRAFAPQRVNPQREFFEIDLDQVLPIINVFPGTDITPQVEGAVEKQVNEEEPGALQAEQAYAQRRPRMNYGEMGIPPGSVLMSTIKEGVSVTVANETQVLYNDELTSLTRVTQIVTGYHTQPGPCWSYNGRPLRDIYNDTYPRMT